MQAVHLSGGALTLGLAAALLCAGCAPLPSASQGSSAPQVSTVSASLSQVSSLRGALDRLEPEADCLVLASGGEYYRFERNGVDVSGLIPGDPVTVTYTGALDPRRAPSPQSCSPSPGTRFKPWRPHPQVGCGRPFIVLF